MSSTFIERSPESDKDKSLILIMDGEGNVTADPVYFEKLINNQKIPEMGIKIVRFDPSEPENGNEEDPESKPELKLTVEEIYPENLELTTQDPEVSTSVETLPGTSSEHVNHDIVDPFSQMDPEQLQKLKRALASEQAKQILGENVTAMLDMLSVDDNSPAAFLQNSIKNDHCYTNLLPSSDPNGPSFLTAISDNRHINGESSKGKGKARVGTPVKGKKIVTINPVKAGGSVLKKPTVKEVQSTSKQPQTKVQTTVADYGASLGSPILKPQDEIEDPSYEEDVDVEDSESSGDVEDDNLSDEDYSSRSTKTRRKPRKSKKRLVVRKPTNQRIYSRSPGGSKIGKRTTALPETRIRNEKLNDTMSKVVQWIDYDSKEDDNKFEVNLGHKKLKTYRGKVKKPEEETNSESEKTVVKETPKAPEEPISSAKVQQPKYPKRENRKPPAHLADALGPALFSAPDIIKRVPTGEDLPQTPPEKKNFTVGIHSTNKLVEKSVARPTPAKVEIVKDVPSSSKEASKTPIKESVKVVNTVKNENIEMAKSGGESRMIMVPKTPTVPTVPDIHKIANIEIQKIIEKQPVKPILYEEDDDSNGNIDDNYYLDPTQMDHSLLEGFAHTSTKSEDQLLQDAILLQEQLIQSNKETELPDEGKGVLKNQIQFGTETIEDIKNEITLATLVDSKKDKSEPKKNVQINQKTLDLKETSKMEEAQTENEQEASEEGSLVVDESRPEDRRRNSAKRRRSDEVSDLDSDLDDALSEASWNSEDDPDRLWCICRKPHNNRFMICCDICEEWFHGKCVGITKAIGKQMEQDGLEWSCPNCTKKKKMEENQKEAEKVKQLKEKLAQSIKDQQIKIKENQKTKAQSLAGKEKQNQSLKQTKISDFSQKESGQLSEEEETVGRKCIMCKGPVRENSIYCSDDCIRKHSQHAISQLMADKKQASVESPQTEGAKVTQKVKKEESRIVVMDSNSKKFLKGQNAPTAANLATWLKENPSYRVVYKKTDNPEKILFTSKKVFKIQSAPSQKIATPVKPTQLKLAISPNSKQINISQPGKKIFQILTTTGPAGKQTAVKPKPAEVVNTIPLQVKTILPKTVVLKTKPSSTVVTGTTATTVTKATATTTTPPKEAIVQTKKRREKIQRQSSMAAASKDSKIGQANKQEDGKEKDKEKKDADQQIRESVKKSLAESLKTRVQESKHFEYNEEVINSLAIKIEEKLFKHFENKVDTKYKSKYRSLIFNIRDPKNETLFKKIVDNSITPKELVKLSPEELASQELARWREKENQHQLEIIKKTELELMTKGNTYIMKSHKGEQVIESDHSGHAASVATEIDPNTPAQDLVSALNSARQDVNEEEEKSDDDSESSSHKAKKKERERRSKDRKHDRRDKDRKSSSSSSSRSRSHRSKDKKRSRSRDRDKDKSKYRYKDKKYDKKERDSKDEDPKDVGDHKFENREEIKEDCREEQVVEISEKSEISTSENVKENVFKKHVDDDDADREPSSTVNIKTPDINMEEPEPEPESLWKGSIVMADVARFCGSAMELSGDCSGLSVDIGEKVDVVGRIPYLTVWDYIARMKKMGTKDILVIKIVPTTENERPSYETLFAYLSKRARIGVIGKTSEAVKDFYIYPLASHSPLPKVLLPLDGPKYEGDSENILLGIVVRNKHRGRHFRISSTDQGHSSKIVSEVLPAPETIPDRSYTPPLPDKEQGRLQKKDKQKRKIRVRVDYSSKEPIKDDEDDDSPYSPEDSDDDLPPLPKIPKPSVPSISSTTVSKLLSSNVPIPDSNLQDPVEIQKKIEEMNRAIEEQTQQIQTLTSAVPKLAAGVLPTLPILSSVTSTVLPPPSTGTNPASLPSISAGAPKPPPQPATEKVQLPLISSETEDDSSNPSRSFTPPLQAKESIPFLPGEVTSKISLPSNLQEILNSIQKKPGSEELGSKETGTGMEPSKTDIDKALNVLNQTKSLLSNLSTISTPSNKLDLIEKDDKVSNSQLRSMTEQELVQKAREMEMGVAKDSFSGQPSLLSAPCPPQPLVPGPPCPPQPMVPGPPCPLQSLAPCPPQPTVLGPPCPPQPMIPGPSCPPQSLAPCPSQPLVPGSSCPSKSLAPCPPQLLAQGPPCPPQLLAPVPPCPPQSLAPCPPQPPVPGPPQSLVPSVQDIPLLSPIETFTNPPPPSFYPKPLMSLAPVDPSFMKSVHEVDDKKPGKKFKLDPKAVFESEGVPDFNIPGHSWDDRKNQKIKNFKIDIKLGVNALEKKPIDTDHFDIESINKVSDFRDPIERQMPSSSINPPNPMDESTFDADGRILPRMEEKYRIGHDRRRSSDRDMKRDWKYDGRRHWDDGRRYKDDYRRYDRRDRPNFRKDRYDDKRNRHLQKEWDGSIKSFEERQRRRNEEIRREEMRRSRQRADSTN